MRVFFYEEEPMLFSIADELRKKQLDFSEASMIRVLEDDSYTKYLKWKAAIGLRNHGTLACIPALKSVLDYPNEDVKNSAILTISHIAGETELDFLVSLLERKKLRKAYVLWAISAVDSERALPGVIAYLSKTVKIDRRPATLKNTDVEHGLLFLDRFSEGNPAATELLEGYGKIWDKFDYFIQKSLKTRTAFYKEFTIKR